MMRRTLIACCVAVAAAASLPAHATEVTGSVRLATGGPTAARTMHLTTPDANGTIGFVFRLGPRADGARYTLRRTRGATGLENLDVYFYDDLGGTGSPCPVDTETRDTDEVESGVVCPGPMQAAWAVVVLRTGADAGFSFSV